MTGEVVRFGAADRARLYREQAVPRGRAPVSSGTGSVESRIERITRLLTELDELARLPGNATPVTLEQVRAGLDRARRIVPPWAVASRPPPDSDLEGAPQPELDDERIERLYRDLGGKR